jgi:hypothetical protein
MLKNVILKVAIIIEYKFLSILNFYSIINFKPYTKACNG